MQRKQAQYGQSKTIDKLWEQAQIIKGKDKNLYRKDPYNNEMYKYSIGKSSQKGSQVDHIKPQSRGGSDNIRNLQLLNSKINMSKGNTLIKKSRHSK